MKKIIHFLIVFFLLIGNLYAFDENSNIDHCELEGNEDVNITNDPICFDQNAILTLTMSSTDVVCDVLGTAMAAPAGGTAPYSYSWSNGESTAAISGLILGKYYVTVMDAIGYIAEDSVQITNQSYPLTIDIASNDVVCDVRGDATATASSLTGTSTTFSYLWSDDSTSPMLSDLGEAYYTVTATDENGCIGSEIVQITNQSYPLTVDIASTPSSGSDGTATANPSSMTGSSTSFTYVWDNNETTRTISGLAPGSYDVTVIDQNGCTGDTTVIVSTLLPVELVEFLGYYDNGSVFLNWSTATEVENEGFYIQRKQSGGVWENIDFVRGQGSTEVRHNYQFEDTQPIHGRSFYRLQQVDFDGRLEYSKVISISVSNDNQSFSLFPNPVSADIINLSMVAQDEGMVQIFIIDQLGRRLYSTNTKIEEGINRLVLPISNLPQGIYFVQLSSENKVFKPSSFQKN